MKNFEIQTTRAEFVPVEELAIAVRRSRKTFYNDYYRGTGPLASILTKFGGRLGCWRADLDDYLLANRKRPPCGNESTKHRGGAA